MNQFLSPTIGEGEERRRCMREPRKCYVKLKRVAWRWVHMLWRGAAVGGRCKEQGKVMG
jgi:hypothetical protein